VAEGDKSKRRAEVRAHEYRHHVLSVTELHRRRDAENRAVRVAEEHLRMIDKRLLSFKFNG
jgi:hypothetical protein